MNKGKKLLWVKILLVCCLICLTGCGAFMPSGDTLYLKGIQDYQVGDYSLAIDKLEKAQELGLKRYEMDELHSVLGHCYLELDMYDEALKYYQNSVDAKPKNVEYIVNLGVAYRQSGDYDKAIELYMQALEIDPEYAELNSSLGSLYILLELPELAVDYFEKAIESNPNLAVPYGNGALAYAMMGDFETAEEYLELAEMRGYGNADIIREKIEALK